MNGCPLGHHQLQIFGHRNRKTPLLQEIQCTACWQSCSSWTRSHTAWLRYHSPEKQSEHWITQIQCTGIRTQWACSHETVHSLTRIHPVSCSRGLRSARAPEGLWLGPSETSQTCRRSGPGINPPYWKFNAFLFIPTAPVLQVLLYRTQCQDGVTVYITTSFLLCCDDVFWFHKNIYLSCSLSWTETFKANALLQRESTCSISQKTGLFLTSNGGTFLVVPGGNQTTVDSSVWKSYLAGTSPHLVRTEPASRAEPRRANTAKRHRRASLQLSDTKQQTNQTTENLSPNSTSSNNSTPREQGRHMTAASDHVISAWIYAETLNNNNNNSVHGHLLYWINGIKIWCPLHWNDSYFWHLLLYW